MSKDPMKIHGENCRRKPSYFLNDLRNFNIIFRKDVTNNNIKSHKKPGLHPHSRSCIFGKTTGVKVQKQLLSTDKENFGKKIIP